MNGILESRPASEGTVQILGIDGEQIELGKGKWYINPKAGCERRTMDALSRLEHRMYARIESCSMGWGQQLAVILDPRGDLKVKGRHCRRLTAADISRIDEIDDADIRRGLTGLEEKGVIQRRAINGGDLHKGNVEIYFLAKPLPPKEDGFRVRAPGIPDWVPDALKPAVALARRLRIPLPEDFNDFDQGARTLFIAKYEPLARTLQEAQDALARELKNDYAQPALYKEEVQEVQEVHQPPASRPVLASTAPEIPPPPPPKPQPVPLPAPIPEEAKPAGRLEGLTPQIEQHLKKFPIPDPLTPETVAEVAKHITTPQLLERFRDATAPDRFTKGPPRKWAFFIQKAQAIARDSERYREAEAGNGHSPPPRLSRGSPPKENLGDQLIEEARRTIADEHASEEQKELAREIIRELEESP
jgi:hypothetical protein